MTSLGLWLARGSGVSVAITHTALVRKLRPVSLSSVWLRGPPSCQWSWLLTRSSHEPPRPRVLGSRLPYRTFGDWITGHHGSRLPGMSSQLHGGNLGRDL